MKTPPLQPLHGTTTLNRTKLNHYARLTTAELLQSLVPGQPGSLKLGAGGQARTAVLPVAYSILNYWSISLSFS